MLVQQSTTGAIGRLYWHSRGLTEHSEAVLVQQSTAGAPWYSRVLLEHPAGTEECYESTRKARMVQNCTIGALGRRCCYSGVL